MKTIFGLLLAAFAAITVSAQSKGSWPVKITRASTEYEKECGTRPSESQTYSWKFGTVTKVLSANRIAVAVGEGKERRSLEVILAGVALGKNKKIVREFLIRNLMGKRISITGNPENDGDSKMLGIIGSDGFEDVNRYLIEQGMADFAEPEYEYGVSYVTMCVYEQELAKAKSKKIGIWADTPTSKFRLFSLPAQDGDNKPSFTIAHHRTGCDPAMESQMYGYRTGKVIAVRKDNKLIFRMVPDNTYTGEDKDPTKPYNVVVTLVGIDHRVNAEEINAFLRKHALGRIGKVTGNARNAQKTGLVALVTIDTEDEEIEELNEYLIEKGIAKFNHYKHGNIVPMCSYYDFEDAEIAAKKVKIGIWADNRITK